MTNQSEISENLLKEYANEKKNIECIDPIDHYDAFYFCAKKMIEQDEKKFKNNMFYTNLIDVMAEKIRKHVDVNSVKIIQIVLIITFMMKKVVLIG